MMNEMETIRKCYKEIHILCELCDQFNMSGDGLLEGFEALKSQIESSQAQTNLLYELALEKTIRMIEILEKCDKGS